ncbi:MAG TPA: acyl dehydratase [Mycobacteriales bacterium]|nr:acyl dehydratase [Mycobacteriales bacterium]
MSAATTDTALTFGDVSVGDDLPPLSYNVTATTVVLGALASRDWRPQHHDYAFATQRNGVRDIFLNSPNQAAWLERFVTDWSGPRGRLGKLGFRMLDSIFPGDTMTFTGTVVSSETDDVGCGWVGIEIKVSVGDRLCTTATAKIALPTTSDDNPWSRRGDDWKP